MAFKTLEELTGVTSRARNSRFDEDELLFATDEVKPSKSNKNTCYVMRIGIPRSICKKARFVPKDKVEILFDVEGRAGLIRRVTKGGLTLSLSHKNGRFVVKATYRPGMPTTSKTVGCLSEVTEDGIVFMLPDSVSFEKNLRA